MKKILKNNFVIVGLTFTIPGLLAIICKSSFSNYKDLIKPKLAPPSFIFPLVWSILYILMSIAIILVINKDDSNIKIYYIQLLLNALWTPIFFLFKMHLIALVELFILLITVIYMTYKYYINDKRSGYLLLPYTAWNLFAIYLNYFIVIYN